MKKLLSLVFSLVLIFNLFNLSFVQVSAADASKYWDGTEGYRFESGSGTASSPYIIKTPQQLAYFMKNMPSDGYSDKYIKLASDIYLNNTYNWVNWDKNPPKNLWEYYKTFKGTFDGDGHTIYGLYGSSLFRALEDATLKNLRIAESFSIGGAPFVYSIGPNSVVKNCYNEGNVLGSYAGGIAVKLNAYKGSVVVENCYNTGEITATYKAGGIAAEVVGDGIKGNAEIVTCYNSGNVTGGDYVGGIAGYVESDAGYSDNYSISSKIWNCYNCGNVTGKSYVGGIAGQLWASVSGAGTQTYAGSYIKICYTVGAVSAQSQGGPVLGNTYTQGSYNDIGHYKKATASVSSAEFTDDSWTNYSYGTKVSKEYLKSNTGLPNSMLFEFGGQDTGYEYPTIKGVPHKTQAFYNTSDEVEIDGINEYGQTLTVLFPENYLKYKDAEYEIKWFRDGVEADGYYEKYHLYEEDIGHRITAMICAEGNFTGAVSSREIYIEKATREPLDISGVVICDVMDTSFGIRLPAGVQARLGEDGDWVHTNDFEDLSPDTEYTVYFKIPENNRYKESDVKTITVKTDKPHIKGIVTISGENLPGKVLTASVSGIEDGQTYMLQWYRDGEAIEGANDTNYIVTKFDRGRQLSCAILGTEEFAGAVSSESMEIEIVFTPGDVDGNGTTEILDLADFKLFLAGMMAEEEIDVFGADQNEDSKIDTADLALLKITLANME